MSQKWGQFLEEHKLRLQWIWLSVLHTFSLVLTGLEIIFFTVACTGLWFGFVWGTGLITQRCFHYCRVVLIQSQGLFCISHHCNRSLGVHKKVGGSTARKADPKCPKAHPIPYTVKLEIQPRAKLAWGATAQGPAGDQLIGAEQLFSLTSLVFLEVCFPFLVSFLLKYCYH